MVIHDAIFKLEQSNLVQVHDLNPLINKSAGFCDNRKILLLQV